MYVNLRRYPRTGAGRDVIEQSVKTELLPELRKQPGFMSYFAWWDEEGAGVSASVFEDGEAAHRSSDTARRWVMRHQDFFPERGEEFSGDCFTHAMAPEQAPGEVQPSPYALARTLSHVPGTQDTRAFVQQRTLPMITRSPGFRGVFMIRHDRDASRAAVLTLFDSREHAEMSHARALELLREGLPQVRIDRATHGASVIFHAGSG